MSSATPRRPRVLMIAPSLDILGGQSRQAARLLGYFRHDSSVEVVFLPVNPRLPGVLRALQRPKYIRTIVTTLAYWVTLLLRVPKHDVLHIFSASYFSYLQCAASAMVVGKLFRKKILLNYRSGEAEDHLNRWKRTTLPTLRLADAIVVPSGYLVDVFAQFGLRARSVYNTVDVERFVYRERRPVRPVFLANRLLEPLYNVACILRAFALIQQRFPDARLTVAGEGSQRPALQRLAAELDLRGVEFVGGVSFDRMHELIDAADIYLNSPDVDNMPASILECFASGLPVVSTNVGGVPYIVTHETTGLLVPRNDHHALASAAMRFIDDPEFARRLAAAARESCDRYCWGSVRNDWLSVYTELFKKVS